MKLVRNHSNLFLDTQKPITSAMNIAMTNGKKNDFQAVECNSD